MKTVAILSLKGGVGKTSICINVAACIAERKHRVAVVDLDPQQSACRWASRGTELDVHSETGGATAIKAAMNRLAADADICILDCPPELQAPAMAACLLANLVLIPASPSPLDVEAATSAIQTAREARTERGGKFPLIALVPSKLVTGTVLAREIRGSLADLGEVVAPSVGQRVAFVESAILGQSIATYAPGSPGHLEFKALAAHVLKMVIS